MLIAHLSPPTSLVVGAVKPADATVVSWGSGTAGAGMITVTVGQTVEWLFSQSGDTKHTVTSGTPGGPDALFESGYYGKGLQFYHTFETVGTFPYYSRADASLLGTITVVAKGELPNSLPLFCSIATRPPLVFLRPAGVLAC